MTYAELLAEANRIAHVLRDDLGLVPGNRVLLRGFNNDVMAACWFAVVKAGGVVVTTMPLLRAKELTDVVNAAQITHALCDCGSARSCRTRCRRVRRWAPSCFSHDDACRAV